MKIEVSKGENQQYYISVLHDENPDQASGFEFNLGYTELKELNQKITDILQTVEVKSEIVWNPRSQRHEKVRK